MASMRHLLQLVVVAVAICSASTAYALEHAMRVGEVLLSRNGSNTIQYIELQDQFQEPFPNAYRLEVYNASATMIGMVALNVPANTQRMLIATAAADTSFGTTRDATLPVTLPTDGQACFVNNANVKIHCVAWGCVTTVLVGATRAPSPPDGQSSQMQANGTYQVGTPTPDAANQAGAMAANCPTEPDAPPMVDGPSTMPDAGGSMNADAGNSGGNNNPGDDTGCCQVKGSRGAAGAAFLALGVLLALRRSRRKPSL
jgi:hypothetical protein